MNNKPADEKDTLDPDRNPDIKNPDGTATLPPESAPAASPIERFYGNMHQSAPIVSLRNRAAAEIHSNPVIMLDRLVGQSLGGESGTNFRWNCCDGGVVKPSKLIATLKTLLNDIKRASTHQNFAAFLTPDGITNLLCEYRDLLKGLAADYGLEEEFMEHSRKLRLP